jgi:diaminohydroxyphosphoribosylaminopyrimidine deaminase/5-amino-6-(5-phosphoribosylamino)uracil reductase
VQTPPEARILDAPGEVLVYTAAGDPAREQALRERGALMVPMAAGHGKVDLAAMLANLAQRGVNELHVEAGHKLNASLLREGLVDELLIYLAPKLLGIGREMAALGPLSTLADALDFQFTQVDRIGKDLRILARPPGRADFLDN